MLTYHNIENFKFPSSEEIFLQPSSYNEYTGFNKYPVYAWWSIEDDAVIWMPGDMQNLIISDLGSLKCFRNEVWDQIKEYFKFDLITRGFIKINDEKYSDVQFLVKFEWDEGDRSVGIWPGYNVSLMLNNDFPIYRTLDYVEL